MVFIQHGLRVGIFITMATLAALTLWRAKRAAGDHGIAFASGLWSSGAYLGVFLWLLIILVLSKTIGALAITLMLIPVVGILGTQLQTVIATGLTALILLYPALRAADVVPVEKIVAAAENVSTERAGSLQFRLSNEDILLYRAALKPAFGWGGWGRSRVFDPVTGKDVSVTDGSWIIAFGTSGWAGYLAQFTLLTLPILTLSWRRRDTPIVTTGLTFMLVANMIDLIPNSGLTPLTWLLAGTLMARRISVPTEGSITAPATHRAGGSLRYTRFAPTSSRVASDGSI